MYLLNCLYVFSTCRHQIELKLMYKSICFKKHKCEYEDQCPNCSKFINQTKLNIYNNNSNTLYLETLIHIFTCTNLRGKIHSHYYGYYKTTMLTYNHIHYNILTYFLINNDKFLRSLILQNESSLFIFSTHG